MTKNITIMGLGYIGLPSAALLASSGYKVNGCDINKDVVDTVNSGNIHIVEPKLDSFVKKAIDKNQLVASTEPKIADIYMICVPTPFHRDESPPSPNIELVLDAAKMISKLLKPNDIVILESTSPVGTTEKIVDLFTAAGVDITKINIAYCPERVLPGNIIEELIKNDRIVGGYTPSCTETVTKFYETFVQGAVFKTDHKTAEMCKLTENSFRDVNIAFANELSILCDNLDIDVWKLISLANMHPRVDILQPGTGVGGHCIAVDPWFIVSKDNKNSNLIRTAREVNNSKTDWVIKKIKTLITIFEDSQQRKPNIACLGLSFKPNIDDLRESPARKIVEKLLDDGIKPMVVEPNIEKYKKSHLTDLNKAIKNADMIFILVNHKQFSELKSISNNNIYDFCGALKN